MATQADRIRQFVLDRYVTPARGKGHSTVTIRAGDVHRAMRLASAMPAVCSAIGSKKFEELAGVSAIERTGPAQGANVYFRFSVKAPRSQAPQETSRQELPFAQRTIERIKRIFKTNPHPQVTDEKSTVVPLRAHNRVEQIDLANAIVLVSCVKSKLPHPAPARSLYTSTWFRKTRDLVEARGARWFVLSARYGLVAPNAEIAPYDHTLNTLGVAARRDWATSVLDKLLPQIANERRVVIFAGQRYREFLIKPLEQRGIKVEVPMEHLAQGEQLAWLSDYE